MKELIRELIATMQDLARELKRYNNNHRPTGGYGGGSCGGGGYR